MKPPRRRYVTAREARRLAALARECGVDIANVTFHPDGRVEFLGPQTSKDDPDAAIEEHDRREFAGRA